MVNVIDQLQAYDIPHTSFVQAIRHMREHCNEQTLDQDYLMLQNLTGIEVKLAHSEPGKVETLVKTTLWYVIQDAIKSNHAGLPTDGETIVDLAIKHADQYLIENPWIFAKPEDDEPTLDPITGKAKMKKGKKQEVAIELYKANVSEGKDKIIQVFQDELDMSKAGARTYYYNMKKKFGDD
jgi:hypothetical protein